MKKSTIEKRLSIEEQIKQLENQRKQLVQQERSERLEEQKKRQLLRGCLLEKLVPRLVNLSDDEVEKFIKSALQKEPVMPVKQSVIMTKGAVEDDEK